MKKYILLVFVVIIALAGYFLLARGQHKLAANAAVSVTDSTGAKVHIPAEPKRIVFLNASNLEIFASIGGKAVGRPTSTSYPNDIKESIKDIPEVGMIHAPNLEKIMNLKLIVILIMTSLRELMHLRARWTKSLMHSMS